MTITSKFDVNAKVWCFSQEHASKVVEGTVKEVQSWDIWAGFRYLIEHENADGNVVEFTGEERYMYSTKNDAIGTIFVEDKEDL